MVALCRSKASLMMSVIALLFGLVSTNGKAVYRGVATNEWSGGCADLVALSNISWYAMLCLHHRGRTMTVCLQS
jgi:hypothetical protein